MAIGTAGYTAALSVNALERWGRIAPGAGEVLVTGAAGGVGSVSVALLASRGYTVTAATGRPDTHDYLRRLGATGFVERAALAEKAGRCRRNAGLAPSTASAPRRSPMCWPRRCATVPLPPAALPAGPICRRP